MFELLFQCDIGWNKKHMKERSNMLVSSHSHLPGPSGDVDSAKRPRIQTALMERSQHGLLSQ